LPLRINNTPAVKNSNESYISRIKYSFKGVHRAYAKRALMQIPSLEDYERKAEGAAIPLAKAS
jgi:hypothetical protein